MLGLSHRSFFASPFAYFSYMYFFDCISVPFICRRKRNVFLYCAIRNTYKTLGRILKLTPGPNNSYRYL